MAKVSDENAIENKMRLLIRAVRQVEKIFLLNVTVSVKLVSSHKYREPYVCEIVSVDASVWI